jgi:hypothetical protein
MKIGLRRRLLRRGPARDCGGPAQPRYRDRSFLGDEVSPDQACIEGKLDGLLAGERGAGRPRWLHVGIGGSRIARRYAPGFADIDGVTVQQDELDQALALALPGYRPRLLDKYGPALARLEGPYSLIIDNNPSSFACCLRHFDELLQTYAARLAPGGLLLTASRGLAFCEPYAFGLRPWELGLRGRRLGLRLVYLGDTVWGLRRPVVPAAAPEPAGPSRASTTSSTSPSSKKSTST